MTARPCEIMLKIFPILLFPNVSPTFSFDMYLLGGGAPIGIAAKLQSAHTQTQPSVHFLVCTKVCITIIHQNNL